MIGTSQLINTFSRPCFTDTTDIFKDGSGVALYGLDYDASDAGGASGKFGEAAIFNGTSSKIELPSALSDGSTTATGCISFWFNVGAEVTSSTPSNEIMQFAGTSSLTGKIALGSTSGYMSGETFSVTHNVSGVYTYSTTNIPAGWNHAVVQWNSSDGKWDIYINSVKHTTYTVGTNAQGYFKLKFGNRSSAYYTGSLDQIRIYTSALTQSQVTQLYQENSSTVGTHLFGCIANYNLDGNAKESMGTTAYDGTETDIKYRYDGTPTNVDFGVGGKSNYGTRFNGNTSVINTNYVLPADSTMSFSFWAKFDAVDNGSQRDFFGNVAVNGSGSNADNRLVLRLRNDNNFSINIGNGSNYWSNNTVANATPYYNQWTFLCVTLNGTSVKVYINNSIVSLTSSVAFGTAGALPLFIGEWGQGFGSKRYKGSIDQFRIFNKELSTPEVSKLYGNGAGEIACKYTSTTDNVAYPIANTAYYKLDNNSKDSARSTGKFNEGAIFNGSNSKISLSTISNIKTYSFWINPDSSGNATYARRIFGDVGGTSYTNSITFDAGHGKIVYYEGTTARLSDTISYNTWSHIAFTSDGTTLNVYTNGSLSNTYTTSSFVSSINEICSTASNRQFKGKIDQVRIYNTALDSTDVSNLYAETVSDTSTLSFPSGQTAIATYKLDGNSTDLSGNYSGTDTNVAYAFNGTESNIEYRFGRFGQAAVFNGSSSKIALNKTPFINLKNNFSYSLWFNSDNTSFQTLFSHLGNNTPKYGVFLNHSSDASQSIRFFYSQGTNSQGNESSSANVWNVGQWHHLVITKSSTDGLKGYLDNTQIITDATLTDDLTPYTSQNGNSNIGIYQYLTSGGELYPFNGKIDQVRIFSSALTSTQVTELYNEKPEVDTSNFKTVLYTGDDSTQYISNVGFEPDLVWVKNRTGSFNHILVDSIRGANNLLFSDTAAAALTSNTTLLSSIDELGFTVGYDGTDVTNGASNNYVAWVWKGGGEAVNIGVNSITGSTPSIASDVSANTAAGFSIVKATFNTSSPHTVAHGLSSAPEIIFSKRTSTTGDWFTYSKFLDSTEGEDYFIKLNETDARSDSAHYWNDTAPTNDVFTTGAIYDQSETVIFYCWHSVAGYSKIGTYTGGTNGIQLPTGFKASWIMIKKYSSGTERIWYIYDTKRDGVNDNGLFANLNNAESSGTNFIDFNDTNIQINATGDGVNGSGSSYLYMAFK